MAGSKFCFHHNPATARKRTEARRRGGLAVHGLDPTAATPEIRIKCIGDCLTLLETAASDCLTMEPSLARARTLVQVALAGLRSVEVGSLEERLEALEERLT